MTKFEEIIKNGTYEEFKDYCKSNDFIIEESIEDNSYVFSLTKSEEDTNILINGIVTEDSVSLYITSEDGDVIDKISESYDNDSELLSYLKGALVTSNLLSGETGLIDDPENDILTEDENSESSSEYSTVPGGLEEIKNKVQEIGNSLRSLSDLSNSLEITSIVMDLANSAYALALDIDDSIESYNEIMEIPEEDNEEELDPDIETESHNKEAGKVLSAKLNLANSILSIRGIKSISKESREQFENICKSLFE